MKKTWKKLVCGFLCALFVGAVAGCGETRGYSEKNIYRVYVQSQMNLEWSGVRASSYYAYRIKEIELRVGDTVIENVIDEIATHYIADVDFREYAYEDYSHYLTAEQAVIKLNTATTEADFGFTLLEGAKVEFSQTEGEKYLFFEEEGTVNRVDVVIYLEQEYDRAFRPEVIDKGETYLVSHIISCTGKDKSRMVYDSEFSVQRRGIEVSKEFVVIEYEPDYELPTK